MQPDAERADDDILLKVRPLDLDQPGSIAGMVELAEIGFDMEDAERTGDVRLQVATIKRIWELMRRQCTVVPPATDLEAEIKRLNVSQFREILAAIQGSVAVPFETPTPLPAGRPAKAAGRRG
jgi:hypothetical protein